MCLHFRVSAFMKSSSTTRLEAFSDCVFAIAITLLVLEIHVPAQIELRAAGGLWAALAQRWPNYVGFLLSFWRTTLQTRRLERLPPLSTGPPLFLRL
jgi:uncharacterized membrane protein